MKAKTKRKPLPRGWKRVRDGYRHSTGAFVHNTFGSYYFNFGPCPEPMSVRFDGYSRKRDDAMACALIRRSTASQKGAR